MTGRPRSTDSKHDKLVQILVTSELLTLVAAAAKREGRSVSDWGRRVFEREVTRVTPPANPKPRSRR